MQGRGRGTCAWCYRQPPGYMDLWADVGAGGTAVGEGWAVDGEQWFWV